LKKLELIKVKYQCQAEAVEEAEEGDPIEVPVPSKSC
jgi:hypothetical protein